jgi:membrane-associated phospholipid phosphatase
MAEILTQVSVPYSFFAAVLNLQPGRHRRTFELMSLAATFASAVGQRFKHHFRVIRPADRSSLVQPLLQTPSHSAFPAGHATQAYLIRDVLIAVMGAAATAEVQGQLTALADRIGENRVVAGVHYVVDIAEGGRLGTALAAHLVARASSTAGLATATAAAQPPKDALGWLWAQARAEWA